jgi:DNA-binding winged helix-turn-helix (wHTH) protein
VRVSRLRQALGDSRETKLLKTVYGEGYVLSARVEPHARAPEAAARRK